MPRHLIYSTVKIKPGNRPSMEQVADEGESGISRLPGFESVVFFLDEERSIYGGLSIWESKEAAEATVPQFTGAIGDMAESAIETETFEIYEPQS